MDFKILQPGDETALETFLAAHADTSMFLRSNLRDEGLRDEGRLLQGTWAAAMGPRGSIVGVAQLNNRGYMPVQAPEHAVAVALRALQHAGRKPRGAVGPWQQIAELRDGLGLEVAKASREDLFSLSIADLVVPSSVIAGRVRYGRAIEAGFEALVSWRIAYMLETGTSVESDPAALERSSREGLRMAFDRGDLFVLDDAEGTPVAMTTFNSRLPDMVQIGGVYTPPEHRGRGYARAAVAGSLIEARAQGVGRAILFTRVTNEQARRAYVSLGFQRIGDYGILGFAE